MQGAAPRRAHVIGSQQRRTTAGGSWHGASKGHRMFFSLLPEARHLAVSEFLRDWTTALRRATPGQAPIPVYRPAASRFLIAGLCAWVLWQPLKGSGESLQQLAAGMLSSIEAPAHVTAASGLAAALR